ncbi:EKC/KEOPS complex subunit Gon7p [Trichomonascus vanleenenianus]|uniref:chromatin DNA-binding EKC/KEOPS complex subunit GON7 n=1 Tax=Trichomonascus vanleenenianus TaxID=2268995 RepID=UPI003ECB32E6
MAITASYKAPDTTKEFAGNASAYKPTESDRNAPVEPSDSDLGVLRKEVVTIQADINKFLTERMKSAGNNNSYQENEDLEKRLLDGNDEDLE